MMMKNFVLGVSLGCAGLGLVSTHASGASFSGAVLLSAAAPGSLLAQYRPHRDYDHDYDDHDRYHHRYYDRPYRYHHNDYDDPPYRERRYYGRPRHYYGDD